ncbi:MAG: hypothetical protein ACE5GC_05480 [Acidimicrobiia bacterium]
MRHRTAQIATRNRQIDELHGEIKRIEREIAGYESAMEALLLDLLGEARQRALPQWSPRPVTGFRAWTIHEDGLAGVWATWNSPHHTAACTKSSAPASDIPHSDGSCGRLGCGIYAVKDPQWLIDDRPLEITDEGGVVGLVRLTGKVVEHERGYRAARAEVVAVAAWLDGAAFNTADPGWISNLFMFPERTLTSQRLPAEGIVSTFGEPVEYLRKQARKADEEWTSASSTG